VTSLGHPALYVRICPTGRRRYLSIMPWPVRSRRKGLAFRSLLGLLYQQYFLLKVSTFWTLKFWTLKFWTLKVWTLKFWTLKVWTIRRTVNLLLLKKKSKLQHFLLVLDFGRSMAGFHAHQSCPDPSQIKGWCLTLWLRDPGL
jgi:hypothetical protein